MLICVKAVSYKRSAVKALRSVPAKDRKAIIAKIEDHAAGGKQDVTVLVGTALVRLRHGNWRAVFEESDDEIMVMAVAHRRDIYR